MCIRDSFNVELQGVRVVAGVAGVVAFDVEELGVVHLAIVLIATLGLRTVLRGRCCEVVDVAEAKVLADRVDIFGETCVRDDLVHADRRLTSLVAFHAARLVAKVRNLNPRGEDHAILGDSHIVVAGLAGCLLYTSRCV